MKSSKPRSKLRNVLITQSIAVVAFVLVPVAITLMAPITDLEFIRTESGVQAIVRGMCSSASTGRLWLLRV